MLRTLLIGLLALGCAEPPAPEQDAGPDRDAAPVPRAFTLEVAYDDGVEAQGPLRLLAEPLEGPGQVLIDLADEAGTSRAFTIDGLDAGRWRLTVFVDRAADGEFDGCPYPPQPGDPLLADRLDNHHGRWEGPVGAGSTVTVTIERHLCGPGAASTGFTGTLALPADVPAVQAPILMELRPTEGGPRLRLPLFPDGVQAQRTRFSVGELLPGAYEITVFADEDGDGQPSACGPVMGGGDRWLTRYPEGGGSVVLEAGARVSLDLALHPVPDCPDELTGLSVELFLDAALEAALTPDPDAPDDRGLLTGPVWVGLIPPAGGAPVESVVLWEDGLGALPATRWITGLEPGPWSLVAWVDRDADGRFGLCGGLGGGLDVISGRRDVQVGEGRVRTAEITLVQANCEADVAGVTGAVLVPLGETSIDSGRPVRLDITDADGGDRLSLQLFENHWRMQVVGRDENGPQATGRFALSAELPPGAYTGVIYLDTDRDGRFTPCDQQTGVGDRASSRDPAIPLMGLPIQIAPGQLTELGTVTMREHACPVPYTTIALTIVAGTGPREPAAPLRLRIDESGGWHEDLAATAAFDPVEGAEFTVPRRALPPGRYRLTAYLDTNGDGAFDDCEADPFDGWVGRVEVEMDPETPLLESTVVLEPACGR